MIKWVQRKCGASFHHIGLSWSLRLALSFEAYDGLPLSIQATEDLPAKLQLYAQGVALDGLIHSASLPERIAQIVVGLREVGLMCQRLSVCCYGPIKLPLLKEHPCTPEDEGSHTEYSATCNTQCTIHSMAPNLPAGQKHL